MKLYPYILLPLFLSSCLQTDPKVSGDVPVSVRSVNYNADRGVTFSLYDVSGKDDPQIKENPNNPIDMDGYYPVGGDNLTALAGGGINCCVNLPVKWRPGLKYTVLWQEGVGGRLTKRQHTVIRRSCLNIRNPKTLRWAFYPNYQVEFVLGSAMAGEAGWKGREKADPLTACMAKNEKKFCYMYLPHYENVDDQFAEWIRKDCRHVLEGHPEKVVTVSASKQECLDWEKKCLADLEYPEVSNKEMCRINWRSPEYGE